MADAVWDWMGTLGLAKQTKGKYGGQGETVNFTDRLTVREGALYCEFGDFEGGIT